MKGKEKRKERKPAQCPPQERNHPCDIKSDLVSYLKYLRKKAYSSVDNCTDCALTHLSSPSLRIMKDSMTFFLCVFGSSFIEIQGHKSLNHNGVFEIPLTMTLHAMGR